MATRMQQRRGLAAQWETANPVLAAGEIGFEIDTNKFKMGDGLAQWLDLPYFLDETTLGGSFDDYVPLTEKGAADGVATLDANGQVPVSQLGNIIDGAPAVLDTLNELAAAIGDDASFITSVNTELGILGQATTDLGNGVDSLNTAVDNLNTTTNNQLTQITNLETEVSNLDTRTSNLEGEVQSTSTQVTSISSSIDSVSLELDNLATTVVGVQTDLGTVTDDLSNLTTTVSSNYTTLDQNLSDHNADTTNVHGIADTSVLVTTSQLELKQDKVTGVSDTEIGYLDGVTSSIQTQLDGKAASSHTHAIADVTGLQTAIDGKASLSGATFTGDVTVETSLIVDGNLTVSGTTTTVSAQDLVVSDPLIYIGEGNTANLVDLGLVSSYNDGTYQHAGIVRDSSANKWKIFKGVTDEPTTTVNFTQGSLDDLAVNNVEVAGVVFSDGTQTKQGVPSITPINQKTASYTTVITDRDSLIEINSASGTTLTIPADASVNYPVGTSFDVLQTGAGQVTIAGQGGVTVNATPGLKLRTQWSSATIFKRAANTWVVYGDLSA